MVRWIRKDGKLTWTEQRLVRLFGPAGELVAVEGIVRDVTRRKAVEEALRESEEQMRNVLASMSDALFVLRPDGTLRTVNREAERLLGRGQSKLAGRPFAELFRVPADGRTDGLAAFLAGETVTDLALDLVASESDPVPVALNGAAMRRPDGTLLGLVGVARDMTETRRLVAQAAEAASAERERAGELEAAMNRLREAQERLLQSSRLASLGQFAAGMAHDFNNLLTPIIAFSELAAGTAGTGVPVSGWLDEVTSAARRAAGLINQLLAFAQRQTLELRILDLDQTLASLAPMLRMVAGDHVRLEQAPSPGASRIRVDRSQLEQLLVNLVANARDAMPHGGTVALAVDSVDLAPGGGPPGPDVPPGRYVRLTVRDTGVGIPADVLPRIFDPFFTTKDVGRGTGLGLATCHGIVVQSGGAISVASQTGRGATRLVRPPGARVPRDAPAVGAGVASRPAHAERGPDGPADDLRPPSGVPRGTERILVVEDDPSVRAVAVSVLSQAGYDVVETGSGRDALRLVGDGDGTRGRFDLLLTDVVMPEIGGRSLASRVAAVCPGTRVLYMSGHPDRTIAEFGVLDRDVHFLRKPFSVVELAAKVREVLDAPP
jgi:PAS domain S-box-containing protein